MRREETERGPACGAAHRRTPIKGSRHVRVRRPVSPAAGTAPGAGHPKGLLPEGPPQVPLVAHTRGSLAVVPRALRPAPQRPQPQASVVMRETTTAASRAPQPRPLARPRVIRRVGVDLVSHRSARPSVATIATATATAVAAARPATITANPAVVTAAHRIVVTRITAPLAAVRLATRLVRILTMTQDTHRHSTRARTQKSRRSVYERQLHPFVACSLESCGRRGP